MDYTGDQHDSLVVSVEEAARLLGIGERLMYTLLAARQVQSVKVGRRRLIPRQALHAFVAQATAAQNTAATPAGRE